MTDDTDLRTKPHLLLEDYNGEVTRIPVGFAGVVRQAKEQHTSVTVSTLRGIPFLLDMESIVRVYQHFGNTDPRLS